MKELPKELTPELLGLVLDREVREVVGIDRFDDDIIHYLVSDGYAYGNIDTLTRLMEEFIVKDGTYNIEVWVDNEVFNIEVQLKEYDYQLHNGVEFMLEVPITERFEAVIKATIYVAKEKGLLC